MAGTTGRLQAFVAFGTETHFAVCHLSLGVLGVWLFSSALESSNSAEARSALATQFSSAEQPVKFSGSAA